MTARAYSLRGEGALIHFRSQIHHKVGEPFPILVLSTPSTMQVTQLRKETRYEVNLASRIIFNDQRANCEIRDLSKVVVALLPHRPLVRFKLPTECLSRLHLKTTMAH